ncbi:MAG: periplasmic heavy metal sensor [Deltaproteobacteria bacterium]|nr:periplasmic heavy metal sensor [Deltaproteobacteria bacterium]MBW1944996.1 periplasmic heavy metal sensor [Deltaproteobacteria bacterium]MBW2206178.1 periplasmic heavy metal sensor [Deltaproteobacteria bacterium]
MKKVILITVVLLFVLSGMGLARVPQAGKDRMALPPVKWWTIPQVAEKLSLTKEEKQKLDTLYYDQRGRMIDLRSQAAKDRLELEKLFNTEPFDSGACLNSFKKSQEARNTIGLERFKFLIKVREILGNDRFQTLKGEFKQLKKNRKIGKRRSPRTGRPRT